MEWTISAPTPFSLPAVIRSHGWFQLAPFSVSGDFSQLTYVDRLSTSRVVALHLQEAAGRVRLSVEGQLEAQEQAELNRKAAWMLDLERDFSDFYQLARNEPKLAHVERGAQGRLLRSPTLFEDVIKTITTTNTTWGGTKRMVNELVGRYGSALSSEADRHAFPLPEQIATASEEELRKDARLGYRAPYVLELARSVASGSLDLEALKASDLPTPELRKRLLAIKGVGGYAAANLLMLLGRYDFVPIDSWALKVVSQEWYAGEPVGPKEVEAAFERWGAWKGLVYFCWNWDDTGG